MSRRKPKRGKGRPFVKGPDPRRHVFTTKERQQGYLNAWWRCAAQGLDHLHWLVVRVRKHYGFNQAGEQMKNPPLCEQDD